ncbi:LL-diaminopimelate aminotransferase [[Clostridium] ultunense Esp]|nr:LL-diaminopimelate aminotransferase [[Clostridium] ultunense Esp]
MDIMGSRRMDRFATSVFSELAHYKRAKKREGLDLIDLSVGSPDLPPPTLMMEELKNSVLNPSQYGYTLGGIDLFHEAVAAYYESRFGVHLDPEQEVISLMGSQDGLVHLPMAFVNPEDLVIVPDPGYPAYETGAYMAGAEVYRLPLKRENRFLPDLGEIPTEVVHRAKMIYLNFPGNPVPALATREFFAELIRFAKKYEIIVVHDFAYSELIFDGKKGVSFLSVEGAKEVGVEFNSLSKSFNFAGARVAYLVGNEKIIQTFKRLKSNIDYGIFMPIQRAAARALKEGSSFLENNARIYEKRRNLLIDGLARVGWKIDKPPATMFVWAKIPEGWSSREFTYALIDQAGVIVTPGDGFGPNGEGYVRIGLVQPEEELLRAVERIERSGVLGKKTISI